MTDKDRRPHISDIDWLALEKRAFAGHRDVIEKLDSGNVVAKKSKWSNLLLIPAIPLILVYLAAWMAPVWIVAAITDVRFNNQKGDPFEQIPLAGVMGWIALGVLVIHIVWWLSTGRKRNGFFETSAWMSVIMGFFGLLGIAMKGQSTPVEDWELWAAPVAATAALGLLFGIILSFTHFKPRWSKQEPEVTEVGNLSTNALAKRKAIQSKVSRLSDAERIAIKKRIFVEVDGLVQRGLLRSKDAQTALHTELGGLALRMSLYSKPKEK